MLQDMDCAKDIPSTTKVLLIHGTADVTVPPYNAMRLARVIPNCEVRFMTGATHFYPKEFKVTIEADFPSVSDIND